MWDDIDVANETRSTDTKTLTPTEPPESDENDRPTISPPFDVAAFARAVTAPGPERGLPSDHPTGRPPNLPEDAPRADASPQREQQITVTNEVELERARLQSVLSEPWRQNTPSPLSIVNALVPSAPPPGNPPAIVVPEPTSSSGPSLQPGPSSTPEIIGHTFEDPTAEMRVRFSLGDYSGALEMSELLLAANPANSEAAERGETCRVVLEKMLTARLGPLDRVMTVAVPPTQMRWLSLDHRAGFILSLVDGCSSIEMILDVSGMPKLDALRILDSLVEQKIVAFR